MKKKQQEADFLTRRRFLGRSACSTMALTGVVNTLAHLQLMQSSLAQGGGGGGYKALVVLFLFGGNDSNNSLIPRLAHPQYTNYKNNRGVLAQLDDNDNDYVAGDPASIPLNVGGVTNQYGVHPSMREMQALFDDGDLSFISNVGTLAFPTVRDDFFNNKSILPPQLFSHSDQQIQWQSSIPDKTFTTGWGGRAADILAGSHSNSSVALNISLAGINSLQVGANEVQYAVTPNGAVQLSGYGGDYAGQGGPYANNDNGKRLEAFDDINALVHDHLLEEGYNEVVRRSRENESIIGSAIGASEEAAIDAAFTNATSGLADQLKMIAKLISGRSALSNTRQIFFCSAGGFDTHQDQLGSHSNLMADLSSSLGAFNAAMKDPAVDDHDNVVLMSHSDFTRTLTPNGDNAATAGSDHGWGGHQFVMGGPVDGGKVMGTFPTLVVDGPDDAGSTRGRWVPTTSVDQYSSIAADWMGVSNVNDIFPNLSRFNDPFSTSSGIKWI